MKTRKETSPQVVHNKYSLPFKGQALGRTDRDGIPKGGGFGACRSNALFMADKTPLDEQAL
ncbi:hypothetical protein [Methyloglobulus sp.]|uniref:hypothetical protein n=1 Tax=Methyloglobulus sp. TaxID=2518622 RepID=UPI003988A74A